MSVSPSIAFKENLAEVDQLLSIHAAITGAGPGRRHKVEVLHKSAILFLCAAFEAFIETLATEAFTHITSSAKESSALPSAMRREIAAALKADKNELRVWDLSGNGWRAVADGYKTSVLRKYTGPFNTPKPHNIATLMRELVGLEDLRKCWSWQGMSSVKAQERLKAFVALRGALAHGEKPAPTVGKQDVTNYVKFLAPLSVRSSNQVRLYCHSCTKAFPWPQVHYGKIA